MLRLSANLSTLFTELPLLERPAAAAGAGFSAVEMQFPYEIKAADMAAACRSAGVSVVLINLPAGDRTAGQLGLACLPGRESSFQAALGQAIDYAQLLGCGQLNSLAGRFPKEGDRAACWQSLVSNTRHAAERCAEHNIMLLAEILNPVDVVDFVLARSADGVRLLRDVGHANLKLQFDLYHRAAAGEDWESELRRQIGTIGHIQFSDYPGRHEPGSGQIDWQRFFATVAALPYEGHVGCEYFPSRPTLETFAWKRGLEMQK